MPCSLLSSVFSSLPSGSGIGIQFFVFISMASEALLRIIVPYFLTLSARSDLVLLMDPAWLTLTQPQISGPVFRLTLPPLPFETDRILQAGRHRRSLLRPIRREGAARTISIAQGYVEPVITHCRITWVDRRVAQYKTFLCRCSFTTVAPAWLWRAG